jgi:hypothetical protein
MSNVRSASQTTAKLLLRALAAIISIHALVLMLGAHAGHAACSTSEKGDRWAFQTRGGVPWLISPCGAPYLSIGVNTLTDDSSPPLRWDSKRKSWLPVYETAQSWANRAAAQLRGWGFNTAGAFSAPNVPLNSLPDLDLGWRAKYNWADPFDPAAGKRIDAEAKKAVIPYKGRAGRIGYFSDNEIGWWNGAMFRYYIKQPATSHTKQTLIAMLRRHYGGDWNKFSRDFTVPHGISSFSEMLLDPDADAHLRPGGDGIRTVREWTTIIARHYYELVYHGLHQADPDALIFGDRLPSYYDPDAVRAMLPYVDAISTNYNVDSPDGWIAHFYFDSLGQLSGNKPVLVSEWYFAARENRSGNRNNGHLMSVRTQAERARGAASAARHFALAPGVVGLHWFQYRDEPKGGRIQDREDYNFGLLDTSDRPYEQLVSALTAANHELPELHRASAKRISKPPSRLQVPKIDIDPETLAFERWPKDDALVKGFRAHAPEVVFGDFFLGWSQRGVHLATICMDHYDAHLLDWGKEFPRSEAFRIDFGVDAGAGAQRFAFYVIPPKGFERNRGMAMSVEVCRIVGGKCEAVPSASAVYQIGDRPRVFAQITLPWQALGIGGPPADKSIRVQLAATAFYRSRWMSLGGVPPAKAMENEALWKSALLTDVPKPAPAEN